MVEIDGEGRTTREINSAVQEAVSHGADDIRVRNTGGRHNLGVAILRPVRLTLDGSVGYYCAGLSDGPSVEVSGSAGWGLAESMMNGMITVRGHAGNGAGAAMRGGIIVVHGDAAARAGVSMKGGTILIGGNCGYMAGFMAQKGVLVVCGDTGEAFADSMYEAACFVGGKIGELGNDAVIEKPSPDDLELLESLLSKHFGRKLKNLKARLRAFQKVVAGRKLWNFDKREWKTWKEAL
ncbi:MAG: glutamate synthase [Planctomycetes bacterium]|nr:glutamate synthase [Planctomycetota bacterium]